MKYAKGCGENYTHSDRVDPKLTLRTVGTICPQGVRPKSRGLGLVMAMAMVLTLVGIPSASGQIVPDYEDVPEGHVAEPAITWATQNGITVGVGNDQFGVAQTLTRYQMVTFLCRAFEPESCDSGAKGSDRFDDVPANHWANYPVGWAVNRGITTGVSATEFGGSRTLTREEMITFLYRAKGSPTGGARCTRTFPLTKGSGPTSRLDGHTIKG